MRKIISMLLSLLMICSMLSAMTLTASAAATANLAESGSCGDNNGSLSDNLRYTVSGDNKTLTITGSGRMHDFTTDAFAGLDPNSPPWWRFADTIEEIIIGSGVEHIGSNAFRGFDKIEEIFIPGNVKSIGDYAAAYCEKLHSLVLDEGVETVGNHAFRGNRDLYCMWLPLSLKSVGERAFAECYIHDVYTYGDHRDYEQPFTTYWFETDGTLFEDNGYIHYIFYPVTITLYSGHIEDGWSSDDNCHWKSDSMFWKVHYQVGEHTYGDKITYRWDGDTCTALQTCSVCGKEVILDQKRAAYVSDVDDFYDGVKGHYEAKFYYPEYSVQRTPECSIVTDPGGHKTVYPEEGYYELLTGANELLCLSICGDGVSMGNDTCISEEKETRIRVFKLEWDEATNAYIIRAAHNDMVLDIEVSDDVDPHTGSDAQNWENRGSGLPRVKNFGSFVRTWENTGLENQRWLFMDAGGGYVYLRSLEDGWIEPTAKGLGSPIHCWNYTGEALQKWRLKKLDDFGGLADVSLRVWDPEPVSYHLTDGVLTLTGDGEFSDTRFQNNGDIHKIVVEDGITAIRANTFSGCVNLEEVTIKQNCTIGTNAFAGVHSLVLHAQSACILDYTDTYGAESITLDIDCGNHAKAIYQNGTLTVRGSGDIWKNAFIDRYGISSIVIEDGVTRIGVRSFAGTGASSVQIAGSVRSIGTEAFDNCYALSVVSFADGSLHTIGDQAFFYCQSLSEITIPASVQSIGSRVFAKSGLTKIIFRGDCSIGESAFDECYITINVPAGWTQGTGEWYGGYDVIYEGPGCGESEAVNKAPDEVASCDIAGHKWILTDWPYVCSVCGAQMGSENGSGAGDEAPGEVVSCDIAGHKWILTDWPYVCGVCGAVMGSESGSVLSEGNVWIVVAVAAAAVVAVGVLVVVKKKKKPALASGANSEDKE